MLCFVQKIMQFLVISFGRVILTLLGFHRKTGDFGCLLNKKLLVHVPK